MVKISRQTFLILAKTAGFALILFLWNKLTLNYLKAIDQKAKIFPLNMNKTISFHGDYIVLNNEGVTTVLTSHCTHLGCKINEVKNGKLICPCHGSQYDLEGNPIKGPAFKTLKKVPSKVSLDKTTIEVTG